MDEEQAVARHKELIESGWFWRFTGEEPRLSELRESYESLGMEVLLEPGILGGDGDCRSCFTIEGYVEQQCVTPDGVTVITVNYDAFDAQSRTISRIAFANGDIDTHAIPSQVQKPTARRVVRTSWADDNEPETERLSFIATGPNVAELKVHLIEARSIVREAIKTPDETLLDSGKVSGANSLEAAEELLNEIKRTHTGGKEYEDASRYDVTLTRLMAENTEPWTSEVIGRVSFWPLETTDLLVATLNGGPYFRQRNSISAQPVWIYNNLILFNHAANRGYFRHPGHGLQFKLQEPVLDTA